MKKILIFRNSNLGDYLISIPALKLIKAYHPNYKIVYMTIQNRSNFDLPLKIEETKLVDKFFIFKKKNYSSVHEILKLIKRVKKQNFNKLYYLQEHSSLLNFLKHYIFFKFCGINQIEGFTSFFYRKNYFKNSETIQICKRVNKLILKKDIKKLSVINTKKNKKLINKKYITFGPGGFAAGRLPNDINKLSPKKWKTENWHKLTMIFLMKFKNYNIVITGTKNDNNLALYLKKKYKKKIINMCGKTNMTDFINILKYSSLHVCRDNGSMHLATVFKKKCVCIFNNHDYYNKWFPINSNAKIIRLNTDINTIKPTEVYQKIKQLLSKKGSF